MSIDLEKPFEVGSYMAAFVDLLGSRSRLKSFDSITECRSSDIPEPVKETLRAFFYFREAFESFYKSDGMGVPNPPGPLDEEKKREWDVAFRVQRPLVQVFADNVLVSREIGNGNGPSVQIATGRIFTGCSMAALHTLAFGKTLVRGGISIGCGANAFEGDVLSSAQVKAYELESQEAVLPRILIDPSVLERTVPPATKPDEWDVRTYEGTQRLWQNNQRWLRLAPDGYVFLDYLGKRAVDLVATDARSMVARIDQSIRDGLQQAKLRKHQAKWTWTAAYWMECRPLWEAACEEK